MFNIFFFFFFGVFVFFLLFILVRDRPQTTIWCKCIACWIPNATITHLHYVILIDFQLQQRLDKRALMLRYAYIASLLIITYYHIDYNRR
jgi:hypothetical protein